MTKAEKVLRLSHYVCCEVGAATGIFNLPPGATEPQPLPMPVNNGCRGPYTNHELKERYGESLVTILDAALCKFITWQQAVDASEFVDRFVLPLRVTTPTGTNFELTELLAWDMVQLNPGEPAVLNLRMRAAPVLDMGSFREMMFNRGGVPQDFGCDEIVAHERSTELHMVVAPDLVKGREQITHGEVANALDTFGSALDALDQDD